MKYLLLCYILFYAELVYSSQIDAKYDNVEKQTVNLNLNGPLVLKCNISEVKPDTSVVWEKDGNRVTISDLKGRIQVTGAGKKDHELKIPNPKETDTGNYSCALLEKDKVVERKEINVVIEVAVRVTSNINVVEEEKLKILCQVAGSPMPTISWVVESGRHNGTVEPDEDSHIQIEDDKEKNIENAVLIIEKATMDDRGLYYCIGTSSLNVEVKSSCMVRVIDKLAAVWPFLGICLEVIVLCIIIFIYEKRHNKAEMEESDTDQSPDQKNTPDHGKDSNLRHRQ